MYWMGVKIPHQKGNFGGCPAIQKHWQSLSQSLLHTHMYILLVQFIHKQTYITITAALNGGTVAQ